MNDAVNKGMSNAEADQLKANVINSGKIGTSLGAAQGYIAKKEKEADTQADWIEKQEAANAAILQEALAVQEAQRKAEELQAGLLAYYQGRKAAEVVAVTSQEKEKNPGWGNLLGAGKSLLGSALSLVGNPASGGGMKLAAPIRQNDEPPPPEEKDCGFWGIKCLGERIGKGLEWIGQQIFGGGSQPLATPNINATMIAAIQSAQTQVYATQTAQGPTLKPTATPTPSNFLELQVANLAHQRYLSDTPVYYQYEYPQSNCSNFVSEILWDAGIRFPGSSWDGDYYRDHPNENGVEAWIRTPDQQQLFSSYNGEFRIVLSGNIPLKDDPVYAQILKDYPQLFTPGKVIFTSNRVITTIDGKKSDPIRTQFSHAMIVDINATPGNPIIVEHSGPADYVVENGAYKATWDGDWNYVPNPEPARQPRLLSDMPTGQITIEGYPGTMTKDVTTAEISIVPVEKIDLGAYGLDNNVVNSNLGHLPYDAQKNCYSIQPSLYYCPPTVPTP